VRTEELRWREDFETILAATLERGWSSWLGKPVRVSFPPRRGEQIWREQPLLSALYTRGVSKAVRRYLADSFRYTAVTWRAPAQWLLGTALASGPALQLRAKATLSVSPAIPGSGEQIVIPGNQRVRIVDFGRSRCRVMIKEGFDPRAIATEAGVRGPGRSGPFNPLSAVDPEGRWFEEPLISGFNLARCPPWHNRRALMASAFGKLLAWTATSMEEVDAEAYATSQAERVRELLVRVVEFYDEPSHADGVESRLVGWIDRAAALGRARTCIGHGDFQAANLMFDTRRGEVIIADWEYSARRYEHADLLRWGLGAGSPPGLAERVERFLQTAELSDVGEHLPRRTDRAWRDAASALFLLEELIRVLEESLTGRYHTAVLWSRLHGEVQKMPPR